MNANRTTGFSHKITHLNIQAAIKCQSIAVINITQVRALNNFFSP